MNQQYLQKLSAILEKLDSLSNAVAGTEARLLLHLDTLEGTVAALKEDIEKCALAEGTLVPYPTPMPYFPGIEGLLSEFYGSPPPPPPPPPDYGGGDSVIAQEDLKAALSSCRSRRNLAARRALRLFSPQERAESNCRGVLGKKTLKKAKVAAIFNVSMKQFPLQRLETDAMAAKEMRNAVDECCRKTRVPLSQDENTDPLV